MAFDIKRRPEKTKWVNFSDDERYLLRYYPKDEWDKQAEELKEPGLQKLLFSHIMDWEGIFSDGEPLECNDENKELVFLQSDVWSVERIQFVMFNVLNSETYFNYDQNLKNLKRASK